MTSAATNRTITCAVCGAEHTYQAKGGRLRTTCDKPACKRKAKTAQKRHERAQGDEPEEYPYKIGQPAAGPASPVDEMASLREAWRDARRREATRDDGGQSAEVLGFTSWALDDHREPEKPFETMPTNREVRQAVNVWYSRNHMPKAGEEVGRTTRGLGSTLGSPEMSAETPARPAGGWTSPKPGEVRGDALGRVRVDVPEPRDVARLLDNPLDALDVEEAYSATGSTELSVLAAWLNERRRRRSGA